MRRSRYGILTAPWSARATAAFLAAFGFIPVVNLLAGGRDADWYGNSLEGWLSGTAIAAGLGFVLALVSSRVDGLWHDDLVLRHSSWLQRNHYSVAIATCLAAVLLYAVVAVQVLSGRPLLIDEIVQLMQARTYLQGAVSLPADANPEFFSVMHVVDMHGKVYGQFPAGGPAMLALGEAFRAAWLVGPLFGGISVLAFSFLVRRMESRPVVTTASVLLFALAPFTMFMSASHMNHVTALTWILIAVAALAHVVSRDGLDAAPVAALLCGMGFGMAAAIRPLDAFAFALPAGVWLLYRTAKAPRSWKNLAAAGAGVLLPMLALMAVNMATTGAPLRFGYDVLWGSGLGFHSTPWGLEHTPRLGLELVSLYFLRMQTYLFEAPIPSLLPAIAALVLTRRLGALDRYLIISGALLAGLYFAYWHDGFYLGPRFMYPLVPALALWTARMPALVRERFGAGGMVHRVTLYGLVVTAAISLTVLVPARAAVYAAGMHSMRWDPDSASASLGIRNALVFVRESWGAQLVARMWALGVSRPRAELLYRSVDRCALEEAITSAEESGLRGDTVFALLAPLLADSARTVAPRFSSDGTGRVMPGRWYSARCVERATQDAAGFTLLAPILLARQGGNIYARDLHERNAILLERYPDHPVYLLRPERDEAGVPPSFYRVDRDSALAHWRRPSPPGSGARLIDGG